MMFFSRRSSSLSRLLLQCLILVAPGINVSASPSPRQRPASPPSAASFYVPTVPDLVIDPASPPLHVWSGHISADPKAKVSPATATTAQLFFVLTKARRTADKERLIIWFNGGPGCSSFDGLMMEVGPWRFDGKDSLRQKEGGWEEYANVLYLDQPPGTGYSYTSSDGLLHELSDSADYVLEFLKNWYEVFPEYKTMDTYLAGESYAGQYIPYIADAILSAPKLPTPLKGIAIGNGWMDPITQYPSYITYALQEKLLSKGTKEYTGAMTASESCQKALNATVADGKLTPHVGVCEMILGKTVDHLQSTVNGNTMCVNIYDIRLSDTYPACGMNWPPPLPQMTSYLRRDDVRTALHVSPKADAWTECRGSVGRAFSVANSRPASRLFPSIVERGVKTMLFVGDQDLLCNWVGVSDMIEGMEWEGATGFNKTIKPSKWTVNGTAAGEWTTDRNLTFVKVFGASHMVGYDLPHVAHDMMLRFMDVDFSIINSHVGSTGAIPSSVGSDVKVVDNVVAGGDGGTTTPPATPPAAGGSGTGGGKGSATDEAQWQAYYNAGSAALIVLIIGIIILGLFWFRRRRSSRLSSSGGAVKLDARDEEESIPLSQSVGGPGLDGSGAYERVGNGSGNGSIKGKERAVEASRTPSPGIEGRAVFDVGDSDDENDDEHGRRR